MSVPAGMVVPFAGAAAPANWLICDGSAVSRTTYAELFGVLGTTWGNGDGSTTFTLPDLRGRMVVGVGTGSGTSTYSLADSGGVETVTLTGTQMPVHNHPLQGDTVTANVGNTNVTASLLGHEPTTAIYSAPNSVLATTLGTFDNNSIGNAGGQTGSTVAHENRSPWKALLYIISAVTQ